jgi:Tfp pilus assembly protein PilF
VRWKRFRVFLIGVVMAAAVAAATSVHLPVSTANASAQAAIDRGLFLYYAYNGDDATQAFGRGASLDPHLAMAYWGIALANGPDLNTAMTAERFERAARAIQQAERIESTSTTRERSFIDAMAGRYRGSFSDWSRNETAYRDAMVQFGAASHDENARLLAAEALLEDGGLAWQNGAPASDLSRKALEIVIGVLRSDPSNPMANHLCVHLYDLAPDRTAALPCAQRLDAAPFSAEAEHLAHMPAHYWIEVGNYGAALQSSERAFALLMQLTAEPQGLKHAGRYTQHDVAVGYSAAMMLGNYATAQRWAQRMESAFDSSFTALTALRFGRYADVYATQGTQYGGQSARGLAAIALDRLSEAHTIATGLQRRGGKQSYMQQLFFARLAEADGNVAAAQTWIDRARSNQRNDYSGELIPFFPADELLGSLQLRRRDDAAAVAAFTETLATYPNDPRALFGLAKALENAGDHAKATATQARFAKEWKGADTDVSGALL